MDAKGLGALSTVLVGIGVVVVVVLSGAAVGGVADGVIATATAQETPGENDRLDDADEIHIDVFVHENGSATFVVDYRFENDTDGEWEALRDDVEANPDAYAALEEEKWDEIRLEGENATEREMELSNASVATDTSSAPRDLGHVEVTFEWSHFAYVELNQIEAGDALTGFTLPRDTSLQIFAPEGFAVEEVQPSPEGVDEDSVFWDGAGPGFSNGLPLVVMVEVSDANGEPAETETEPEMPWLVVMGALAALATVGAAGWWIKRDRSDERRVSSVDAPDSVAEDSSTDLAAAGPPPELLSNEERVLRLLEARGGRIKQQEVVSELDWTEAKTSQVVSRLRENDEIEVFRIGRENVLASSDDDEANA